MWATRQSVLKVNLDMPAFAGVPKIETRWLFIVTDSQAALATRVASHVYQAGIYTAFLSFPELDYPYTGSLSFGEDGYLSRAMGERAAVEIGNTLFRLHLKKAVFLGLTTIQKSYLYPRFNPDLTVEADTFDELVILCGLPSRNRISVRCRPTQLLQGLYSALSQDAELVLDERAESLSDRHLKGRSSLIVLEDGADTDGIAAVMFTAALNVDLVIVPLVAKSTIRALPRLINSWSKDHSSAEYAFFRRKVLTSLRSIDFVGYDFVTFFTEGIPYGLFLSNRVPCSHVLRNLNGSRFILNRILDEFVPRTFGSALLFSPKSFAFEEIDEIDQMLSSANLNTRKLTGKEATVGNLDYFASYYPYDVLHICAHGGETSGYFVIQNFTDRNAVEHSIEYYEVVGFSPSSKDKMMVTRKLVFHKLDGFAWMSEPLKHFPRYIFDDLMVAIKDDDTVTRVPYRSPIALSCHVKCFDSIHQGSFDSLAGFGMPVVFNNTCSSSHELAVHFINAGARCYIGTLWNVGNDVAVQAAKRFYAALVMGCSVGDAFTKMVSAIPKGVYRDVYILWGLHFSQFEKPAQCSLDRILSALVYLFGRWLPKIHRIKEPDLRRQTLYITRFIAERALEIFSALGIDPPTEFDAPALNSSEASADEPDSVMRQISDMTF